MKPPKRPLAFLRWFCREDYIEEIEGDLTELFRKDLAHHPHRANLKFTWRVIRYFRPEFIKSLKHIYQPDPYGMYKNYFKIAWRNLLRHQGYSLINIGGLAIGIMVTIFIALWIHDELSFNKYHKNYDDIAQVWSFGTDPETSTVDGAPALQYPVRTTLKNNYGQHFKHVLIAWGVVDNVLATDEKKNSVRGIFIEPEAPTMLTLRMLKGTYQSLNDPHSIILSESVARSFFGDDDPMTKTMIIDGTMEVQVTGVYEDIPKNNRFSEVGFLAPWSLWLSAHEWAQNKEADWDNRPFNVYVQLQPDVTVEEANAAIKGLYKENMPPDFYKTQEAFEPHVQLVPMSTWHLYSEFENGKPAGGRITYVWLFGIVGFCVLLLACINFINLSTARSEKRAREVGVRKVVGSRKGQLISQFLSESLMVVLISFVIGIVLVALLQNWFNDLTDKNVELPLNNIYFWLIASSVIVLVSCLAGLYPAFYLSSVQPVRVLKGAGPSGSSAATSRKVLVIGQFTASVVLIIGTLVVYRQIQFARERPVGYNRESLITVTLNDPTQLQRVNVLRQELLSSGVVYSTAASSSPLTDIWNTTGGYDWEGKSPGFDASFAMCQLTPDFGKTVGWEIIAGRDFSTELGSDSLGAIIINEAAANYMGLSDPVGKEFYDVDENGVKQWTRVIVGVVKDMVMESPYEPVRPTLYFYDPEEVLPMLHIKIHPSVSASTAVEKIRSVFSKVVPDALFEYRFVDEQYALKFRQEERIGQLSGIFAILAIFISSLGLFGLAAYVAERRKKEIGIRKVMGATVAELWQMLSKEFLILVFISCLIAAPLGYYLMRGWLMNYDYRSGMPWWIFAVTIVSALLITMLTVSYQAITAARMDPVESIRNE